MRAYDHEDDRQSQNEQSPASPTLQQYDEDYNLARLAAEIHEAAYQVKTHESSLRKLQREIELRVTDSQLTETIALVSSAIHQDPNVIKLLKTREAIDEEGQGDKLRINAGILGRKLNQMSDALSMLLGGIKRVEARITTVQGDLTAQINEKTSSLQLQLEEVRGQTQKQVMDLAQRVQLSSFEIADRVRQVETKVSWKLNQFKGKLQEKVSEDILKARLQESEERVEKAMRNYQLQATIDPARIDRIESALQSNRKAAEDKITQAHLLLRAFQKEMNLSLVRKQDYSESRAEVEKRLSHFNDNFMDVYKRVIQCEKQEGGMITDLENLLTENDFAQKELKRINTVLLNIKISEDFQRMLEEMNPAKVLQLQGAVDAVQDEQKNIFHEIALAKREISIVSAKSENLGFMMPNVQRQKLRKEELYDAISDFLTDHQFAQKIAYLDKQLADQRQVVDAVAILTKQIARLQKQNDNHRLGEKIRDLQEYFKRELALLPNRLREKEKLVPALQISSHQERPNSNSRSSLQGDLFPVGAASLARNSSNTKVMVRKHPTVSTTQQLFQFKTSRLS